MNVFLYVFVLFLIHAHFSRFIVGSQPSRSVDIDLDFPSERPWDLGYSVEMRLTRSITVHLPVMCSSYLCTLNQQWTCLWPDVVLNAFILAVAKPVMGSHHQRFASSVIVMKITKTRPILKERRESKPVQALSPVASCVRSGLKYRLGHFLVIRLFFAVLCWGFWRFDA